MNLAKQSHNILILSFFLFFQNCTTLTPLQDDIETGLICDIGESRYSEWCVSDQINYHIGYPGFLCYDSMLLSLPINGLLSDMYGNYPVRQTDLFVTYFETLGLYRLENNPCVQVDSTLIYRTFIAEEELTDLSKVNISFYFYKENNPFPVDSAEILFSPWN